MTSKHVAAMQNYTFLLSDVLLLVLWMNSSPLCTFFNNFIDLILNGVFYFSYFGLILYILFPCHFTDLILKCFFFVFRFGAFLFNFFICHYRSNFEVFFVLRFGAFLYKFFICHYRSNFKVFFCFSFWCLPIQIFYLSL
jgi:hypothetical protein